MDPGPSVQDALRGAGTVSSVSERLGISRPTMYRYMDAFDSGDRSRLPQDVQTFFSFLTAARRTPDDLAFYFARSRRPDGGIRVRTVYDGGRLMVMFPDVEPEDTVVRVYADFDGMPEEIAEYRPGPGRRFVTMDDVVPGEGMFLEVVSRGSTSGLVPLCGGFRGRGRPRGVRRTVTAAPHGL